MKKNSQLELPEPNYQDKKTILIALQLINTVIVNSAAVNLAMELRASGTFDEIKLAAEIQKTNTNPENSMAIVMREEARDSAQGASNDGICHLVAVIDALWSTYPTLSLEQVFKKAKPLLIEIMTSYHSSQVQVLDTIFLADKNPYEISDTGKLIEKKETQRFLEYVETLSQGTGIIDFEQFDSVLQQSMNILLVDEEEKKAALIISKLAASLYKSMGLPGGKLYMDLLSSTDVHEKRKILLKSKDKVLSAEVQKMSDSLFNIATSLAQIPGKLGSILIQRQSENHERSPQCTLLRVPNGFPQWMEALYDTLLMLRK